MMNSLSPTGRGTSPERIFFRGHRPVPFISWPSLTFRMTHKKTGVPRLSWSTPVVCQE